MRYGISHTTRLLAIGFIHALCVLCTTLVSSWAQELQDIRVGLYEEHTRIVFESDQAFPYRVFTLDNPHRLILDMPRFDWKVEALPNSGQSDLIEGSRYGLFRPDVLRLVLDLRRAVRVKSHQHYQKEDGKGILILDIVEAETSSKDIIEHDWQAYLDKTAQDQIAQAIEDSLSSPLPEGVVRAPMPRKLRSHVVMIDPGHGGIDPGAIGISNVYEKHIVLNVGLKLREVLRENGVVARMTRKKDYYIPLTERFRMAERSGADLFISLHADAAENPKATGASVYTLSDKASDREAAKLAKKENTSDILVGVAHLEEYDPAVQLILLSMSQRITQRQSTLLAKKLLPKLADATKLKSHAHRSASFLVLKSPVVPSILVELGYMSNAADMKKLANKNHQQSLADKIAEGVLAYLETQKK